LKKSELQVDFQKLCEDLEVMSARSEFELSFYHQPLKSDLENLVNLLLTPEEWPSLFNFFTKLEIDL
jgi:hypothetical protein